MLRLKNIKKSYTTGDFTQIALDGVSLNFRKSEFVAILGHSGSGKTTCLNIIGGLDRYDSGDLIINGKSSENFKAREWDAYRNNSVGFIFQSYNLIGHLNILDNVEMGMTLSGVSRAKRRKKALEVLKRVGLEDHIHKKPNQLSGGQMQRVAIARALANDPDIILADEPTGALDSATSRQIMELIREISKDKLVIMVTHNPEIAEEYADRIVKFSDGKVTDDSNPYTDQDADQNSSYSLKKTSMSFLTALKLSGKNIWTKKGRTLLTAFASSIGIIGIALILSLSDGFQDQITDFQADALAEFPITISQQARAMDSENLDEMMGRKTDKDFPDTDSVILRSDEQNQIVHQNDLSDEYLKYLEKIDKNICSSIGYTRLTGMNLLRKQGDEITPVSINVGLNMKSDGSSMTSMSGMSGMGLTSYPTPLDKNSQNYVEKNYDVLSGSYPKNDTDLVLVVDNKNRINPEILENLGFDVTGKDSISFDEIVGTTLKLVSNDDYYTKTEQGVYVPDSDFAAAYDSKSSVTLKITGIVRQKEDVDISLLGKGIAYSDSLVNRIIDMNKDSQIVKDQSASDKSVFTMETIDESSKKNLLINLGGDSSPLMIYIYPKSFEDKDAVISYLDAYNDGKSSEDTVVYTDLAATMTEMTSGIMDAITYVLIAFAGISLIVSLIIIGIITYISVLERTKEIGVLRALGARKVDIMNVFNAETFLTGACSGLLGIAIAYLLTIPVNAVIYNLTGLENVAYLNPLYALLLVTISVLLTLLGGLLPAMFAARKDPVEALRTE